MTKTLQSKLTVQFCGAEYFPVAGKNFVIGREGDLSLDDNPYLHRRLLLIEYSQSLWWIHNTGQTIAVTIASADGNYQAVIGPGARVPLVIPSATVLFSAGSFSYELGLGLSDSIFRTNPNQAVQSEDSDGYDTFIFKPLSLPQKQVILALSENLLRDGVVGTSRVPTSAEAAARLGWPLTTFNRQLDSVCDRLDRDGVQGLRGVNGKLASQRKARLVEHAVLARLVTAQDLELLDSKSQYDAPF